MNRRDAALYGAAAAARARAVVTRRLGGVTILLYHRVAQLDRDPQQLAVAPGVFADHMAHLRDHCTPVRLRDVPGLLRSRRLPPRPVAVTFDDGYRDNLLTAKPVLERLGVPATVFVASGYVGARREFWWDELERLVLDAGDEHAAEVALEVDGRPVAVTMADRAAAYVRVHALLRQRPAAEIDAALAALRARAGEPPEGAPRPANLAVDRCELRQLDGGAVEIGAHTRTHVSLAAQPPAVQAAEIRGSTRDLAGWLGRPVTAFAYPYGSPGRDVGWRARRLAHSAGHRVGVVNWPRRAGPLDSPLALPRHIVRDWPVEEFGTWLEREVVR